MVARLRWFVSALLLGLIALSGGKPVLAYFNILEPPPEDPLHFPETGHFVSGSFLEKYYSIENAELVYGLPITESYYGSGLFDGYMQFFERALFVEELDQVTLQYHIKIRDLGTILYKETLHNPLQYNRGVSNCRSFAETDFQVCYAFRDFFEANGGVSAFGFPISDFELADGRIVQYFQRARFEWHPENSNGERVQLTNLGELYFQTMNENQSRLLAVNPFEVYQFNRPQVILDLKVRAYPQAPVLTESGRQTLEIIVLDQNMLPISGADVVVEITYPSSANETTLIPQLTDSDGITRYSFDYTDEIPGRVEIKIMARAAKLQQTAHTSFLIWH